MSRYVTPACQAVAPYEIEGEGWIAVHAWTSGLPYAVGTSKDVSKIDRKQGYPVPITQKDAQLYQRTLPSL